MDAIVDIVALLAALSVAAERLVEIIKGMIPWLQKPKLDSDQNPTTEEGWRRVALHLLAFVAGTLTAYLTDAVTEDFVLDQLEKLTGSQQLNPWTIYLMLGLLSSAGSGFWNSIVSYLNLLKNIRKEHLHRYRMHQE